MTKYLTFLAAAVLLTACALPSSASDEDNRSNGTPPVAERDRCGGIAGFMCKRENDYCKFEKGTCRIADNMGHCHKKPEICTEHIEYVCGCDGKTYSNPCKAAAAGMSIDHDGRCDDEPEMPQNKRPDLQREHGPQHH